MMSIKNHNDFPDGLPRCPWVSSDPLYLEYHDKEWGRPLFDNHGLFERLCLEGQQAGLSWLTVLKKRDAYRKLFANFDPEKIARFSEGDLERLTKNPALLRNRLKINSIYKNAKAYLGITQKEPFTDFIWEEVDHKPIINHWHKLEDVPPPTEKAHALCKKLKKAGFSFVGPETVYAFMQSAGLINNHLISCFCHPDYQPKPVHTP